MLLIIQCTLTPAKLREFQHEEHRWANPPSGHLPATTRGQSPPKHWGSTSRKGRQEPAPWARPAAPPLSPYGTAPTSMGQEQGSPHHPRERIYSHRRHNSVLHLKTSLSIKPARWRAFSTLSPAWLFKIKRSCGWLGSWFRVIRAAGCCGFATKQERQHAQIWTRLNFQDWFLLFQAHLPGVQAEFLKSCQRKRKKGKEGLFAYILITKCGVFHFHTSVSQKRPGEYYHLLQGWMDSYIHWQ